MSRSLAVFQVDAFTRRRFTGNPAGVVLGADALSDEDMLAIARELNNADTALLSPDSADHDLRVILHVMHRSLWPTTVAAHYVMSRRPGRDASTEAEGGIVEVEVRRGRRGASQSTSSRRSGASRRERLPCRRLRPERDPTAAARRSVRQRARLMTGARRRALRQLKPDAARHHALRRSRCRRLFLCSRSHHRRDRPRARMFCPRSAS